MNAISGVSDEKHGGACGIQSFVAHGDIFARVFLIM